MEEGWGINVRPKSRSWNWGREREVDERLEVNWV